MSAKWVWDTNGPHPVRVNESGTNYYRWFEDPQSTLGTATASVSSSGEATWMVPDFAGSIIATAKIAGATAVVKYDGFGGIYSGSMAQPLQFHGQYRDSITGLYDLRLRDYSPTLGRFTNVDPIAAKAGTAFAQTYSYAFNSPTTLSDVSGGCAICITALLGAAVGAVVGGVIGGVAAASSGGNVWEGVGWGALGGAVAGGITGLTGNLALGLGVVARIGLFAATGAVSNIAANSTVATLQGRSYGWGDALYDGTVGALTGGGGAAGGALAAKAITYLKNLNWLKTNTPRPVPAGEHSSYSCPPTGGGVAALRNTSSDAQAWVARRTAQLQGALPEGSQGRVTMAAGVLRDASGNQIKVIATSEPRGYIRPGVALEPDEIVVPGSGHAEADIVGWAQEHGYQVISIGAGRPICATCAGVISSSGGSTGTPLKGP